MPIPISNILDHVTPIILHTLTPGTPDPDGVMENLYDYIIDSMWEPDFDIGMWVEGPHLLAIVDRDGEQQARDYYLPIIKQYFAQLRVDEVDDRDQT